MFLFALRDVKVDQELLTLFATEQKQEKSEQIKNEERKKEQEERIVEEPVEGDGEDEFERKMLNKIREVSFHRDLILTSHRKENMREKKFWIDSC